MRQDVELFNTDLAWEDDIGEGPNNPSSIDIVFKDKVFLSCAKVELSIGTAIKCTNFRE